MATPMPRQHPFALQERDISILCGMFESRVMTGSHVAQLYFDGSREAAKKRLQKMKGAGLIGERARRVNEQSILFLTGKALKLLQQQGALSPYPEQGLASFAKRIPVSSLTLSHELEVMDVKAAFYSASVQDNVRIAEFCTWPLLYQFESRSPGYDGTTRLVKPDAFIRIEEGLPSGDMAEHSYFLEVDRSSETLDTLVARADQYRNYYRSGDFAVRNGGTAEEFRSFPFRVLMVFKNEERRNNVAERLLRNDPPISTLVWLSTFAEVSKSPLSPVWIQPCDYRAATSETPYDPDRRSQTQGYRRQADRDDFIRRNVRRLRLLQD